MVRQVRVDELVADVVCEFGAENPTADAHTRNGCGFCAYGKLAEAVMAKMYCVNYSAGPFPLACKELGGTTLEVTQHRLSFSGESYGAHAPFCSDAARAAWGSRTIGELIERIKELDGDVRPELLSLPSATKEWSILTLLMEEEAMRESVAV